jgi:prolyl 4-hydroxylase
VLDYDNNPVDKSHRDSWTAYLSNENEDVIRCVEERASVFQGHVPVENIENLQVVRYIPVVKLTRYFEKQQFRAHYDWLDPKREDYMGPSGNRVTSFFVYLVADCVGGTTIFPEVWRPLAPEWCETLECYDENGKQIEHVVVKPKVGRAIFWYNLDAYGETDSETLHSGAPVINGTKVGLNIWTRERRFRAHT